MEKKELSCIMVIFGGTGDLTHRKLLPAIYNLQLQNMLPESFAVVAVGRREKSGEDYRGEAVDWIRRFSRFKFDDVRCQELLKRIFYFKMEFAEDKGYVLLKEYLETLDNQYAAQGNRIFYLAVSPENYGVITERLKTNGMASSCLAWQRVVIEKPFGKDLISAKLLNKQIARVFPEENTFRIDHYLGKEMVQSILGIRFANAFFEPLWNSAYIDNVQISSCETIGVNNRGEYYDKAGAMGDMMQNHMLQILSLIAMEPPSDFKSETIRDEKLKLIGALEALSDDEIEQNTVFGQYSKGLLDGEEVPGYREESRVSGKSSTETFVAVKFNINNKRWAGTPFYIRTGKRLASKSTEIVIQFKSLSNYTVPNELTSLDPNLLVIQIQPKEEIYLKFNTKKPGINGKICPVKMNFCQNCKVCQVEANSPEAYEKLIFDVINGDSTLFTRWDEVEQSWRLIDRIAAVKRSSGENILFYPAGSWGPEEANQLLLRDNRHWWNIKEDCHENI